MTRRLRFSCFFFVCLFDFVCLFVCLFVCFFFLVSIILKNPVMLGVFHAKNTNKMGREIRILLKIVIDRISMFQEV